MSWAISASRSLPLTAPGSVFEWPAVIVIYIKNPCIGVDAGIVADGGDGGLLNGFKKRREHEGIGNC